ncbi:hypothetical protein BX600DRAFT_542086 [Xylariales sp. PMI_506]|nr:hypothetical protein BX600DRAFT_542086 [Xylariales sp. PMI_506]
MKISRLGCFARSAAIYASIDSDQALSMDIQVDTLTEGTTSPPPKRRRATSACVRCHERKVRCDVSRQKETCTNCRLDSRACIKFPSKRRGRTAGERQTYSHAPTQSQFSEEENAYGEERTTIEPWLLFSSLPYITLKDIHSLAHEDILLLRSKGCLNLPPKAALDDLIRHYFLYVHPTLPVINEGGFWSMYSRRQLCTTRVTLLSLFTLQAMLFACSAFVPLSLAQRLGHPDVKSLQTCFYQKAKLLYDLGAERDALSTAQGALLLSHHFSAADPHAGCLWLSIAIRNGMAVQMQLKKLDIDNENLKSCNARLWWCIYLRDRIRPLLLRRPMQLSPSHLDQILEVKAEEYLRDEMEQSAVYDAATKAVLIRIFQLQIQLALALTEVLPIVYSPYPQDPSRTSQVNFESIVSKVAAAKLRLSEWADASFEILASHPVHEEEHESIQMFAKMTHLYYLSARIALYNYEIAVLGSRGLSVEGGSLTMSRHLQDLGLEVSRASQDVASLIELFIDRKLTYALPLSVDRYEGANDMMTFTARALEELGASRGSKSLATPLQSFEQDILNTDSTCSRSVSDNVLRSAWTDILAENPRLYIRAVLFLDYTLAMGEYPKENNLPISVRESEDVDVEVLNERGTSEATTEETCYQTESNDPISPDFPTPDSTFWLIEDKEEEIMQSEMEGREDTTQILPPLDIEAGRNKVVASRQNEPHVSLHGTIYEYETENRLDHDLVREIQDVSQIDMQDGPFTVFKDFVDIEKFTENIDDTSFYEPAHSNHLIEDIGGLCSTSEPRVGIKQKSHFSLFTEIFDDMYALRCA